MNTHNIAFYEEMTKFIFYLSSNIIKYCRFGNVRENLIFAYICEFVAFGNSTFSLILKSPLVR